MATWVRVFASVTCLFGLVAACAGSNSDGDDEDNAGSGGGGSSGFEWVCFEGATSCWCAQVGPGRHVASSEPEVLACRAFTCCLYVADPTRGGDCNCEDLTTDCQAEASTRPGTVAVPSCPPGPIDLSRCAASGVNCREDFLQQEGLLGCCPGLTCQVNAEGIPVCL
jgi:hypothetical protein